MICNCQNDRYICLLEAFHICFIKLRIKIMKCACVSFRIRSLEAQFHRFVSVKDTADLLNVDMDVVDYLYYYWVLKRRVSISSKIHIFKLVGCALL